MQSGNLSKICYTKNINPISLVDPFGLSPLTVSSLGHGILDLLGFIPGIGEVSDLVNTLWYLFEGDYANAAWSAIAILPLLGSLIAKARYGIKLGKETRFMNWLLDMSKYGDDVSDAVKSGSSGVDDVIEGGKGSNKILWGKWEDYKHASIENNEYAEVGERLYTRHAVARTQPSGMRYTNTSAGGKIKASRIINAGELDYGRSISPSYIEDIINKGKISTQVVDNVNRTVFSSGTVDVITEQNGKIVVTILTH